MSPQTVVPDVLLFVIRHVRATKHLQCRKGDRMTQPSKLHQFGQSLPIPNVSLQSQLATASLKNELLQGRSVNHFWQRLLFRFTV